MEKEHKKHSYYKIIERTNEEFNRKFRGAHKGNNKTLACSNIIPVKTNVHSLLEIKERLGEAVIPVENSGGYVYFIWEHNQHNLVKIGWTGKYARGEFRCSIQNGQRAILARGSLQAALPRTLLAFIPGNKALEDSLHFKFKEIRFSSGSEVEWFYPHPDLLDFISKIQFCCDKKELAKLSDSVPRAKQKEQEDASWYSRLRS